MKKILNLALGLTLTTTLFFLLPVKANQPPAKGDIDALINNQKYAEALKLVQISIEENKAAKKDREWAKLIIQEAMLKIGLHGYETAVKDLRHHTWPTEPVAHAMVSIVYARTLQIYHQSYSWEIRKREKVEGKEEFDLKSLTADEIYQEAYAGFEKAWKIRNDLGKFGKNELFEIVAPNNYPQNVRGSLRDTLTYLLAAFLNDSSGWTAEESNSIYMFDPDDLLSKDFKINISEKGIHPFWKVAYVLRNLEEWNYSQGKQESGLEAKLELHRLMWQHLTSITAKNKILASLEKEISRQSKNPWVSMAYGTLGTFLKADEEFIKALAWARKGAEIFPNSSGAALCRDIVKEIESPSLGLEGMNIDTSPRRSFAVQYRNLRKVYFRSYKVDFLKFINTTRDYSLRPGWRELETYLKQSPAYSWDAELRETSDYKQHRFYSTPPKHRPGFYAVLASSNSSFNQGLVYGVQTFFSDYTFELAKDFEKQTFQVKVTKGSDGEPVKDAVVRLFSADYQKGHQEKGSQKTDKEGKASFVTRSILNTHNSYFFVMEKDGHLVASRNPQYMYASGKSNSSVSSSFIYTDRSIYRPEQKVLWKVVAYRGDRGDKKFQIDAGQIITMELRDANGETVGKAQVKTNKFGSASGEFSIPKGKLLGNWSLSSSAGGSANIKIEEYKRPTFLVEFDEKANELRLNKDALIRGKAKYYFGMPVSKGKANWTIYRQAILPWWCFWGRWNWGSLQSNEMVSSGSVALKDDGAFEIKFRPLANEDVQGVKDIRYNYQVKVTVTDEGGETQSADLSNTIGFSAVTASLIPKENFYLAGKKVEIEILRYDLNGRPLSGKGKWKLIQLKLPSKTLSPADIPVPKELLTLSKENLIFPDDMKQPRWDPDFKYQLYLREWEEGNEIASGEANHPLNGKYKVSVPQLKEGAYRLRYETKDSFGSVFEEQKEILVAGPKTRFPLPGILLVQKNSLEPGETARLLVTSGFSSQRMILETFQAGKKNIQRTLISGKDSPIVEFPVTEDHRGGLSFTLSLITDYQDVRFSDSLMVPWSNKLVSVDFATFRDQIRPGGKEKWSITLSGKNGRKIDPEAFELLAYMFDKSLDSFGPHTPPDPNTIYPLGTGTSFPESELGAGTLIYTNLNSMYRSNEYSGFTPDHVKFYPNYGIGGPGQRGGRGGGKMMMKGSMGDEVASFAMESASDMAGAPMAEAQSRMSKSRAEGLKRESEVQPTAPVEMRSNFAETAFWKPHLVPGKNGRLSIEFTVPDSVTSWNVWAHAISKDLQSGSAQKETRTVKELMVRPYLPRFFREGDEAELRVVINNSSDKDLIGETVFEILDGEGKTSLNREFGLKDNKLTFTAKANGSANLAVSVKVPAGIQNITIKVIARSGNISDGEIRPLPVLPGRLHLAESKFVTLMNKDKAEIDFVSLRKNDDKSLVNDLFIVTLDAQLFYSVLSSLPYLVNYPYQCTEQMMNSFVSSGIISSVFKDHPELGKMAKELSSRKTRLEKWDNKDPNLKTTLEEAPWLNMARGGFSSEDAELISVLHPDIAKNTRDKYLGLLKNSQTSSGGFPWFSGGPPSPWITTYLLYGFSKAIEFKVDVPKEMISRAWKYLHQHYISEIVKNLMSQDVGWETVTFVNYVLSNYPDSSWTGGVFTEAERKTMLEFSMKHWKEHSPYLKSYLALTLTRAKRSTEAKLVWDSVMDSAKTSKDEGTHWAQEDRSWLWYNDTIETHALALRTGSELGTKKETLDGLVHWIFLNKKLNHWKSTRATSEVIYSLTHYLKKTNQLGVKEKISVNIAGETTNFEFNPDKYTGKKNQIVIPADKISAKTVPVSVEKSTPGIAFASATWHYSTEKLPKEAVGDFFKVNRKFFKRVPEKSGMKLFPIKEGDEVQIGDEVEVQLSLTTKHQSEYVHLRDPRAAGFEPVDQVSQHKWDLGIYWYEEIRDNGTNFFFERLPHGQYTFKYRIRASIAGKFRAGPAMIQPLYAPEFVGFSEGHELKIKQQK